VTNLSIVCMCQEVGGALDNVDLPIGISQQVVELLCYCRWCWYVVRCESALGLEPRGGVEEFCAYNRE
jgi:hypothetical protein